MAEPAQDDLGAVAIVGMALRVPGARDLAQFWDNVAKGVESTTFFTDEELRAAGVPESEIADPDYVKASGRLEGAEMFDAAFFDLTPREAEVLDPQHRQLLECGWEALEHAGYAPRSPAMAGAGRVGVFAGVGLNGYLLHQLINRHDLIETMGGWQITLGNDKDFAATRLAYKFDLRGPAVNVTTACSTSLVAVAMGCQSLLSYQCDMILAGGCSIHLPQDRGYHFHKGGTLSSDGRCRAFDAAAEGTFDGSGVAVLILKRLEDARRDGDTVHAVIRGAAINNDGADKVGYSAPSVTGQAAVIREAQEVAGVPPQTIGYVETHGTGTDLGDLVEVAALTEAFRAGGGGTGWCGIGSLKSNLGHLDTAAGAASLIKTVLGLKHGLIPPTLHFREPNPKLELPASPFYVNAAARGWPRLMGAPRRAGVSSFGIGGTNAHVVVEEAEAPPSAGGAGGWQVIPVSARSDGALRQGTARLAQHLAGRPDESLADVAHTLQTGRCAFPRRVAVVARDAASAAEALMAEGAKLRFAGETGEMPGVVFMFPGQDALFPGMADRLLADAPLFRAEVESAAAYLRARYGIDLMARLRSPGGAADPSLATDPLPLFVLEHALAQLWMALGVTPRAMIGYSLGEYTCACLAGVMTRDEALDLAVAGQRLLPLVRPGALMAVSLAEDELLPLLPEGVELSMVMAPRQCVVGGDAGLVQAFEAALRDTGAACLPSQLGLPFHTSAMDGFLAPYLEAVKRVALKPPRIPYVSCVSGNWITPEEATDPKHYLALARGAVRLSQGLGRVFASAAADGLLLLECGPGQTIASLAYMQAARPQRLAAVTSQCDPRFHAADTVASAFPAAVARLWAAGADINWAALQGGEGRRRVPLPAYAFEQQRYWVEAAAQAPAAVAPPAGKLARLEDWFYRPHWQELAPLAPATASGLWLVAGGGAFGDRVAEAARAAGAEVVQHPSAGIAWEELLDRLIAGGRRPQRIVWLGLLDAAEGEELGAGFAALLDLGRAVGRRWFSDSLAIDVVGRGILGFDGAPSPAAAAVLGPVRVLPQEYANLSCRAIEISPAGPAWKQARAAEALVAELASGTERTVSLAGTRRFAEGFAPCAAAVPGQGTAPRLKPSGVYLVTGGLGNIGLTLAREIARLAPGAALLLTGRTGLGPDPARDSARDAARRAAVAEIKAMGASVEVHALEAGDADGLAALIADAERRLGALSGVIHAAGVVGQESFATVAESTQAFCARQLAPKLAGTLALERALGDRPLDFCLLCSSLSPILGGLGFAAYAAANAALDAIAARHNSMHPVRWLSVNWEGWRFEEALPEGAGAAVEEMALTPQEGAEAFRRILAWEGLERVTVSTGDLAARIRRWVALDQAPAAPAALRHSRPEMLGQAVPPAAGTEQAVALLWEDLLGIAGIGAEDSFFELGGNSLLLTQLLARIRKRFRAELSLAALFERPTIAAIAALIDAGSPDRDEGEL